MRRAVLYLSILSVPPAFSIAGATREAKIALCIDLIGSADTTFMEKKAVPKALGRPDKRGDHLLKTTQKHYKDTKGVYETTDAEGNIVYWAHEGSL